MARSIDIMHKIDETNSLVRDQGARTREHQTKTIGHALNVSHQDHEQTRTHISDQHDHTREHVTRTAGEAVNILGGKIDKIGWLGKSTGWVVFETLLCIALFAFLAWLFGQKPFLIRAFDDAGAFVGWVRNWMTWIIAAVVPFIVWITLHFLTPLGRKKNA